MMNRTALASIATVSRARAIVGLALATCAAVGCGNAGRAEVARVPAPSGDVEAVLIETNGGATTSFGYLVHVVEPGDEADGEPAAWLSGAVRSDRAYGVNLRWEDDHTLAVEYLSARDTRPQHAPTTVAGRPVRVVLRDGIADADAPPGGMEDNLRGRRLDAHPRVHQVRTAPGVSLEVFDWGGSGTPLVFLTGGGGHTARVYEEFAPPLAREFRVVGITRRGGGASSDVAPQGLEDLADDVAAVIDTLRLGPAVLVGHSFAGVEMAAFGARHPERCAGLVYLDAAYDYTDPELVRIIQTTPPPQAPPMLAADSASVEAVQAYVRRTAGIPMPASEIRASRAFDALGRLTEFAASEARRRMGSIVRAPRWEAIDCPSLGIYALPAPPERSLAYHDQLDEAERAAAAAYIEAYGRWAAAQRAAFAGHPGNTTVEFPGGNHYFFLAEPDEARRLIADFARRLGR